MTISTLLLHRLQSNFLIQYLSSWKTNRHGPRSFNLFGRANRSSIYNILYSIHLSRPWMGYIASSSPSTSTASTVLSTFSSALLATGATNNERLGDDASISINATKMDCRVRELFLILMIVHTVHTFWTKFFQIKRVLIINYSQHRSTKNS